MLTAVDSKNNLANLSKNRYGRRVGRESSSHRRGWNELHPREPGVSESPSAALPADLAAPIRYVASEAFTDSGPGEVDRATEVLRDRQDLVRSRKSNRRSTYRLPSTIARLCEAPLLTPEQERQLFKTMNYLKYEAEMLRSSLEMKDPRPKTIAEIDQLLAGACMIRNAIVEANTRLVISVVKDFSDDVNPFEDLVSEGITAVMRATETFDYGRGFRFSTYATRSIRSALYRKIMQDRKQRERFHSGDVDTACEPSEEEASEELSPAQYRRLKTVVGEMLKSLDDRERLVIETRYQFIGEGKRPPFRVLAERLGVSKERVRQLEARALTKLRELSEQIPDEILAVSL